DRWRWQIVAGGDAGVVQPSRGFVAPQPRNPALKRWQVVTARRRQGGGPALQLWPGICISGRHLQLGDRIAAEKAVTAHGVAAGQRRSWSCRVEPEAMRQAAQPLKGAGQRK